MLENDRKKLGMDSVTLKIVLSGEEAFEKDLSKSPTLGRGKQGSKMDMMMITYCMFFKFHVLLECYPRSF